VIARKHCIKTVLVVLVRSSIDKIVPLLRSIRSCLAPSPNPRAPSHTLMATVVRGAFTSSGERSPLQLDGRGLHLENMNQVRVLELPGILYRLCTLEYPGGGKMLGHSFRPENEDIFRHVLYCQIESDFN
jgi:hypothetical protein